MMKHGSVACMAALFHLIENKAAEGQRAAQCKLNQTIRFIRMGYLMDACDLAFVLRSYYRNAAHKYAAALDSDGHSVRVFKQSNNGLNLKIKFHQYVKISMQAGIRRGCQPHTPTVVCK